jgi:phenylacetate-CoA ligase
MDFPSLLTRIMEEVPFYRAIYGAEGIRPAEIASYSEFASRVPILRKWLLRNTNPDLLHPAGVSHDLLFSSSGTTGRPLITKYTLEEYISSLRGLVEMRREEGFEGKRVLLLLKEGHSSEFGTRKGFEWLHAARIETVKRFHPDSILQEIREGRYEVLVGLPENPKFPGTSLRDLLDADQEGLLEDSVQVVISLGGVLSPEVRGRFQRRGIDVISSYGSTETAGIASEKRGCPRQHIYTDSLVEVLDGEGRPVREGERGEVVVSTLGRRKSTLYLRLATGDSAIYLPPPCPLCGEAKATLEGVRREEERDLYLESGCRVLI